MGNIGLPEILIVLVVLLVVFGPKRLPKLGRQLGNGMREFKDSITAHHDREDDDDEEHRPSITAASVDQPPVTPKETAPVSEHEPRSTPGA
jgi:sec-independent protein translocase protein TatA